jgi:Arc/MetJ-type ribon-helix-helix transcriptional regulator
MPYQIPTDISERLEACLAGGSYRSEDEVLREALDALDEREREKLKRWQEGNAAALEQSQQGHSKPLDDEAVLSRLRQRLAAEGITG